MHRATRRGSLAVFLLVASLAVPAAAGAVEQEGRGEAIKHVRNIEYPDLHQEATKNGGTDLEFAVITVAGAGTGSPAAKPKKAAKPKRCKKPGRKASRKAKAKYRRCQKGASKRASKADADAAAPGVQKRFAFAGSYGDGLQIVDVTDPANSARVATWDCGVAQGDVQVFRRDDLGGRWFVAYTHDTGYTMQLDSKCVADLKAAGIDVEKTKGYGTYFADVTDPYNPKTVSYVEVKQGSHNGTVHPSGRYFYNSNSDLFTTSQSAAIEIVDISDLSAPKMVGELPLRTFPGLGTESHDVDFSEDGTRAYVAAISHGEILDTSDPAQPKSIGTILDPAINVWHQTDEITVGDRKFLIAEDEFAGASNTGQCPNGGVHVYEITGDMETAPQKVGAWNITDLGPTEDGVGRCTAHVFQLHEESDLMTIAYYNGGVRVVDLSELEGIGLGDSGLGMKQLGWYRFKDSDVWAVKAPAGTVDRKGFFLYGNDHTRGFDVYRFEPTGTTVSRGEWLTPEQALNRAKLMRAAGGVAGSICILPPGRVT